jgi:hypothetical protein
VSFYADQTNEADTENKLMIPELLRTGFDYDERWHVTEWSKSNLEGWVKSVCIGRASNLSVDVNQAINYSQSDSRMPGLVGAYAWTVNWLLRHMPSGTVIYKTVNTTTPNLSYNFRTREAELLPATTVISNNITNQTGGLIIGDTVFRATKASRFVIRVTYVRDWLNSSAALTSDITLPNIQGQAAADDNAVPVMVHNQATGNLELFTYTGHAAGQGCRCFKIIVNPDNLQHSFEEIGAGLTTGFGHLPAAVTGTSAAAGLFAGGKYYLPVCRWYNRELSQTSLFNAAHALNGIITTDNTALHTESVIPFRAANNRNLAYADSADGIMPVEVHSRYIPYCYSSQIVSFVNLDEPDWVFKRADNVLRIRYYYKKS